VAVVTAFLESLPIKYYYDNFTIPLCATLLACFLMAV
jgi:dolichol kinase